MKRAFIYNIVLLFISILDSSLALKFSQNFKSSKDYLSYLEKISELPTGFSIGTSRFSFKPFEVEKVLPMNLTIISLDKPTDTFAAMFTSNKFPGAPVIIGKNRMNSSKFLQAIVVNNKISNVCPGMVSDSGVGDSEEVCQAVSSSLGLVSKDMVFPSSTGIIGWRLPVEAIKEAVVFFIFKSLKLV